MSVAWASERDFNFNHAKYFISDDQWMLSTGNATKSSYSKNREFFVFGQDAQVHQDLVSIFDADFHQKSLSTPVQKITFSPINARSRIIRSLKEAKREIIIFSASVSDPEILELLKKRKEEGIAILLCVGDLPKASEISRFADLLGPEITYIQAKKPYVHAKSILIDQTYLLVGSMNLTANSLDHNREVGLILQNNSIVKPLRELITTQCGAP